VPKHADRERIRTVILAYNPRRLVPYRSEQWAAERLTSTLTSLPGELFAPDLDAYVMGSDKGEQPPLGAVEELMGGYGGVITDAGLRWRDDLEAALGQQRYAYVVPNDLCCDVEVMLSRDGYSLVGSLFPPGDDYWLWTTNIGRTPNNLQLFVSRAVRTASR
jgi:hypothetical protein